MFHRKCVSSCARQDSRGALHRAYLPISALSIINKAGTMLRGDSPIRRMHEHLEQALADARRHSRSRRLRTAVYCSARRFDGPRKGVHALRGHTRCQWSRARRCAFAVAQLGKFRMCVLEDQYQFGYCIIGSCGGKVMWRWPSQWSARLAGAFPRLEIAQSLTEFPQSGEPMRPWTRCLQHNRIAEERPLFGTRAPRCARHKPWTFVDARRQHPRSRSCINNLEHRAWIGCAPTVRRALSERSRCR